MQTAGEQGTEVRLTQCLCSQGLYEPWASMADLEPHLLVLPTPGKAQLLEDHLSWLLLPALLLCPLSLPLVSNLPAESPRTTSATQCNTAAHSNTQKLPDKVMVVDRG